MTASVGMLLGTDLLELLRSFGPRFHLATHERGAAPTSGWRRLDMLVDSPPAFVDRLEQMRTGLATLTGQPRADIPTRVAASLAQLGIAGSLIATALGVAATGRTLQIDPLETYWCATDTGRVLLSVPTGSVVIDDCAPALVHVVDGPIHRLVETAATFSVSEQVLWGNVASALNSAVGLLTTSRPDFAERAEAVAHTALRLPLLRTHCRGPIGPEFRRRSCCLIYRLAPPPSAPSCGDCVLLGRSA